MAAEIESELQEAQPFGYITAGSVNLKNHADTESKPTVKAKYWSIDYGVVQLDLDSLCWRLILIKYLVKYYSWIISSYRFRFYC